jgi:hypothetical protein
LESATRNATINTQLKISHREYSAKRDATLMKKHCKPLYINKNDYSELCKIEKCTEVCIKRELGEDENKKGSWSMLLSRAPVNSDKCIEACYYGCLNRVKDQDEN